MLFFDSRGRNLEFIVNSMNSTGKPIEPWLFEGATIEDLTVEAEYNAQKAPFDIIYIAGGICNVTSKDRQTKKISFTWRNSIELASHLVNTMDSSEKYLFKEHPASTFIFCPLLGADLERVLKKPAAREQIILDEAIWIFNEEVFQRNSMKKVYAPNFADPVYREIRKVKKTFLHHLGDDGIHLSEELQRKWAKKIVKLAYRY